MLREQSVFVALVATLLIVACSKDPAVARQEFLRSGDAFIAQQKPREAIIEYRNAVAADPRSGEARLKLADAYNAVNDSANAFREYIRAADLLPDDPAMQVKAGRLLLVAGQYEDARARADKALAVRSTDIDAQILRAQTLAGLQELDAAVSQIEKAIELDPSQSRTYANLGILQRAKGDLPQAEKSFLQAIATDPRSLPARLGLANFYWSTNRLKEAEAAFEAALAITPNDPLTNRSLASLYLVSGRKDAAEKRLRAFAEADPTSQNLLVLADFYLMSNRATEAAPLLDRAAKDEAGFAPAHVRLAALALGKGNRAEAARHVDEVLAKDDRNVEALGLKSELQMADGKLDEALTTARAAIEAWPGVAKAHLLLGRILARQNDRDGAVKAFEEALRLEPRLAPAAIEVAKARLASGKLDEAIQFAQSALQVTPANLDARLVMARAQLAKRDLAGAEQTLNALAAAAPDSAIVQTQLGRLFLAKGELARAQVAFGKAWAADKSHLPALEGLLSVDLRQKNADAARARLAAAVAGAASNDALQLLAGRAYTSMNDGPAAERAFKQALVLNPNSLPAYNALGQFYARAGRLAEATAEFKRLVEKQPKAIGPVTALGMLFVMQNRPAEARQQFETALKLNPRAGVAANNLAWMLAEEGQELDRALELAQSAKAALPEMAEVSDTLGWVYYKKGLMALAIPPLRESVERDSSNAIYQFHLGLAYAKAGDVTNARQALQRALELKLPAEHIDEAKRVLATVV